jgi:hypothetical protein
LRGERLRHFRKGRLAVRSLRALFALSFLLACTPASGADAGIATLADAGVRLLRAATWYRLVPGARVAEGDIVDAPERAQAQIETPTATVNLAGPGALYFVRAGAQGTLVELQRAWIKAAAKAPGLRVRMAQAYVVVTDGVIVLRSAPQPELFVENGGAQLVEVVPNGSENAVHDAKRGEYWSRSADAGYVSVPHAPKAFVAAMPTPYFDALPTLAGRFKEPVALVADRDITFAEAQPWLAGPDRAAFEKRFASRLRDRVFRRAVEPTIAHYPSWDRMLHPEKFAPKAP